VSTLSVQSSSGYKPHVRLHFWSTQATNPWCAELVKPQELFGLPAEPYTGNCLSSDSALMEARRLWWPMASPAAGEIWKEKRRRTYGVRHVCVRESFDLVSVRIETVEKLRESWFRRPRARTRRIHSSVFLRRFTFVEVST
jgi:hypothetical protein